MGEAGGEAGPEEASGRNLGPLEFHFPQRENETVF